MIDLTRLNVDTVTVVFELHSIPSYDELATIEGLFDLPGMSIEGVHMLPENVEVTTLSDPQPTFVPIGCRLEVTWKRK